MKILFVGGSFDDDGGKPSGMVRKFADIIKRNPEVILTLYNGGFFTDIESILEESNNNDIVIWWANIPNDKPKIRDVKAVNSKVILVTSKRNDDDKYSFAELINRALDTKANLCIEFKRIGEEYHLMLFDPLGNCWYKGFEIAECCDRLLRRTIFLKSITRQGCNHTDKNIETPDEKEFFDVIKTYADTFHELINPAPEVTRFLGNSSFRCQRGFPSFKKDGIIYVSRRNIDKRFIDKDGFVPVWLEGEKMLYAGDYKPSVDTPIQLRLYEMLPNINYMIHSHVYIKNAPHTIRMIPCGGLEEVKEVIATIKRNYKNLNEEFYAVNLIGHGCIVMSSDVEKLKNLDYSGRNMPENMM